MGSPAFRTGEQAERMNPGVIKFYQRMPYGLRCAAASLRGCYLQNLRYDGQTDRKVKEALEREYWHSSQWKEWKNKKLSAFLARAAREVPFYRNLWRERRRKGDQSSWEEIENWPVLTKEQVRQNPRDFVADSARFQWLYVERTGGTTGTPLVLWQGTQALRDWYALFEARWRGWYGISRHDRWAIIGGQRIVSARDRNPPFWVWNAGQRQLYISTYHLFPEHVQACVQAIRRSRAVYLLGYTSALYFLASEMLLQKLTPPGLKVVITNAEPLSAAQRDVIERAFNCPVRETYGLAEMAAAAGECEAGCLHLWPEAGHLEILDGGSPAAAGKTGDLVATGLINAQMPLIRYETGDRMRLMEETEEPCRCGRTLPRVAAVEGRKHDVLQLKDGRVVWYFNPVFAGLPVRESQVIQEDKDVFSVLMTCSRPLTPEEESVIKSRMKELAGEGVFSLKYTTFIPRENNGKFRGVISRIALPSQQRQGNNHDTL